MSFSGFVNQAQNLLGSQALLIRPQRGLFNATFTDVSGNTYSLPDLIAQATIEEQIVDNAEVTDHPVEIGAPVSDHMFVLPVEVTLHLAWSNSPPASSTLLSMAAGYGAAQNATIRKVLGAVEILGAATSVLTGGGLDQMRAIYAAVRAFQKTRSLFTVYTGKRTIPNMVCKSFTVDNDWKTENALFVTMVCKQIIIVNTQNVTLPAATQANPLLTASIQKMGSKVLTPVTQNSNGTFSK